jgi:hypothetical protein
MGKAKKMMTRSLAVPICRTQTRAILVVVRMIWMMMRKRRREMRIARSIALVELLAMGIWWLATTTVVRMSGSIGSVLV